MRRSLAKRRQQLETLVAGGARLFQARLPRLRSIRDAVRAGQRLLVPLALRQARTELPASGRTARPQLSRRRHGPVRRLRQGVRWSPRPWGPKVSRAAPCDRRARRPGSRRTGTRRPGEKPREPRLGLPTRSYAERSCMALGRQRPMRRQGCGRRDSSFRPEDGRRSVGSRRFAASGRRCVARSDAARVRQVHGLWSVRRRSPVESGTRRPTPQVAAVSSKQAFVAMRMTSPGGRALWGRARTHPVPGGPDHEA